MPSWVVEANGLLWALGAEPGDPSRVADGYENVNIHRKGVFQSLSSWGVSLCFFHQMAATTSTSSFIPQEDDEFDWEAAVREIDVACQVVGSTSNGENFGKSKSTVPYSKPKTFVGSRQSTLDKFVRTAGRSSIPHVSHLENGNPSFDTGDDSSCPRIDLEAAKTWIYPVNIPLRDYQLSITEKALFSNTLVALPTGLGKTLIAAVVMYNYFRWFPEGKIVFAAPSRPLVMQQVEACHKIMGIPQEWTIDMTGQIGPSKRRHFWKAKRVFFVTPQVLEKDIQSAKQMTIQSVIDNLHISTLEYRNECDQDVSPYVHNRKLELMEVTMGKNATEINDLLLEAIQPFVSRLCGLQLLCRRDFSTLSPCDLLTSREKFRQAHPVDRPQAKFGEIDGCFGVLITLYHIRKLLSSHGIRPAYEMLEEKLKQGSFARLMSRNEKIWKVKLLMEQSLSFGAPSPKLLKMIEVLTDHFRKSLKGQTQKVQQEVLQKFRTGEYNVIVATSIGEEGLDIMEVDLVICFDANISPLRMIQRMGRTGRKHDGRGYLRKQANSKAVRKHMHNGGSNSFNFHCSPRMVPHICKPEVNFVELCIEQFIPRGKKVKDLSIHEPSFRSKMSDAEADIITKYFHASREDTWRPSLISFPHFQTFPSRVHKVMHSSRTTGMLIDTMQIADSFTPYDNLKTLSKRKTSDVETSSGGNSSKEDEHCLPDLPSQSPAHCFLFGADFVSVNSWGRVLIASFPVIPALKDDSTCVHDIPSKTNCLPMNRISCLQYDKLNRQPNANVEVMDSEEARLRNKWIMAYPLSKFDSQERMQNRIEEPLLQTPNSDNELIDSECRVAETPIHMEMETKNSLSAELKDDLRDAELSPRLTIFVEKGVVPESPVVENRRSPSTMEHMVLKDPSIENDNAGLLSDCCIRSMDAKKSIKDMADPVGIQRKQSPIPEYVLPDIPRLSTSPTSKKIISENEMVNILYHADEVNIDIGKMSGSPIKEIQTPLVNKQDHSSSEDWQLSSGEALKSIQQPHKFKRLCKYVDIDKRSSSQTSKKALSETRASLCRSLNQTKFSPMKNITGKQMPKAHVTDFIEDEAEVSADAEVSEDEEDVNGDNECDDSFIDDRMSSPSSTQAEVGRIDMMAIYRKSLLTQSPLMQSNYSTNSGHESASPMTDECGSYSKMAQNSLQTPQSIFCSENQSTIRNSKSCQLDRKRALLSPVAETHDHSTEDESKMDSRKRKLSFLEIASVSVTSSRQEYLFISKDTGNASNVCQPECNKLNSDMFDDDQFYQSIDLDAVEAQATESLKYKTSLSVGMSQRENFNPAEKMSV
ncbi:ATP-dependent DNA helicase mph1 isoform X1 [Cinnamomum micranthum f. kanehirae]|uniref:ATP-dependent DNA helicase mph1 isoform X1 n=1 Tax=Cinnamomum micranthum f. kanehirae TaxID=337451 RepID=A0A3S3PAV2_9MAGN|nr:ATP-dependent DNA helicase mph1 isoform X1 [Cinnamomum micranthum f. kanehirae]